MQTIPSTEQDQQLWQQFVNQANAYDQSRQVFFQQCKNRIKIIKIALHHPNQRRVALLFFEYLNETERQGLFDDLIDLASVGHSDIELVRQVILSFPQSYLLAQIESSAKIVLESGTDEEYRRLLELYLEIDISLVKRLTDRALKSSDPDISEVGEDFQNYLINHSMDNINLDNHDRLDFAHLTGFDRELKEFSKQLESEKINKQKESQDAIINEVYGVWRNPAFFEQPDKEQIDSKID